MFPRFITNILSWRSVALLTIVAAMLQLLSHVLSWRLIVREKELSTFVTLQNKRFSSSQQNNLNVDSSLRHHDYHLGQKLSDDHAAILTQIARWSVLDSSGEFRVATSVLLAKRRYKYDDDMHESVEEQQQHEGVTLVTQCSISRLHLLPELANSWQGPVSVAIFTLSSEVQAAVQVFLQMQRCYSSVKENVTFSLVFPLNSPTSPHVTPTAQSTPCAQIFTGISRPNYQFDGIQYPNNLLRNVAIKCVKTPLMMVIDADMIPSPWLHSTFVNFYKTKKSLIKNSDDDKTVWVIPAYEVMDGVDLPQDKQHLLNLKQQNKVRPFYQEVCLKCQRYTDYAAWEKVAKIKIIPEEKLSVVNKPVKSISVNPKINKDNYDNRLSIKDNYDDRLSLHPLYEVLWRDPWEPFYISRSNIPGYDERFRQYGFNRISQVCELHVAGYRFVVLDTGFVVHRGFKTPGDFHTNKDIEQERNRVFFRQFKVELKDKYPDSSRRCY